MYAPNVYIKAIGYRKDLIVISVVVVFLSDINCSKNALNVKAKVSKMKLFINQSN